MSDWPTLSLELWQIAIEGAVDRFCGRPRIRNPYAPRHAADAHEAWDLGWADADYLLEIRGRQQAARWLREPAA
jgi:hypothetical protein